MTAVNWGILGAAKFAQEHMGRAIHGAEGARLMALATRSHDKFDGFQSFAPDIRHHTSYEALLADPEIEAVYIPLPNSLHVEWGLKALEAGKHVLVEKPVAMRAPQIDALIAARDRSGLMATEAYMIPHHPQWQRARELVQSGAVGRLRHISVAFSFDNRDPSNIRNQAEMGGGALPDIGVYALGCARLVTGVEPVITGAQIDWEDGVDVMSRMQAMFGDVSYQGYVSTRMLPYQEAVFHGDEGLVRLTAPFNPNVYDGARIEIHQPDLGLRRERFPSASHYVLQVESFCRHLREGADYPWSLEDAKGTQLAIDEVYAAAK